MTHEAPSTALTFKQQELAGWDAKAGNYGGYAGTVTTQLVPRLLEAAGVGKGTKHLDIACGPGYVAAEAAKRGAQATGVDFSPAMVAEANKNFPQAEFRQGDAEKLDFDAGTFEAVTCGFGIGHFAEPDKAIGEAFRVLGRGGRYAFSWWCSNEKHEFFGLLFNAIRAHGNIDVPLPPAPAFFRFSDPEECKRTLKATGFTQVEVQEHALVYDARSPQDVIDFINKSAVRTAMVLELQTRDARARIEEALLAGALAFKTSDDRFRFAWPAIVARGTKA